MKRIPYWRALLWLLPPLVVLLLLCGLLLLADGGISAFNYKSF